MFNIFFGFVTASLFQGFKPNESSDTSPKRILEVGSGPVPVHVLSASRWGDQIICSDFLEQNRVKFNHWLKFGRQDDERWIPYAKYVAKLESEGYRDNLYQHIEYPGEILV